jgi:hypothetical protein
VAPTQANWEQFFLGRQDELTLPQAHLLSSPERGEDELHHELAA